MGASKSHAAGSTVNAGLPNITGGVGENVSGNNPSFNSSSALYNESISGGYNIQGKQITGDSYVMKFHSLKINAARCNSIYGKSGTVQPAAYYVYIWRRTG